MSDDLVDRLRESLESSREVNAKLCQRRDDTDAEIERLRAEMGEAIAERDALRARAERGEGRIADAPAVKAMCADLLTRLQRLSGENPVARVILLPEDWPEIEELIASVNKIAQHEKEPT